MSDFQDEQGLGELPSDLSLSEKTAYILPSIPSADISPAQPQNGVVGIGIPNNAQDLVKFVFDSRPLFGEDFIFYGHYNDTDTPPLRTISFKVPDSQLLIIRSYEYVASIIGGNGFLIPANLLIDFNITIDGVPYKNIVNGDNSLLNLSTYPPQDKRDCFIIVPPGSTVNVVFSFDLSFNSYQAGICLRGNLLLSNGNTPIQQAAGA